MKNRRKTQEKVSKKGMKWRKGIARNIEASILKN